MRALFYFEGDDGSLLAAIRSQLNEHEIIEWTGQTPKEADQITAAIIWKPPEAFFNGLSAITHIFALSAGVDHLLKQPGLPNHAVLMRLEDAGMGDQMAEYVLYGALHAQRRMNEYRLSQAQSHWDKTTTVARAADTRIGILGAGVLASRVAERLVLNGYPVACWSRSGRALGSDIESVSETTTLADFLTRTDVLVCLLPATADTNGILNIKALNHLPHGAFLINPARGSHLVENDLLTALDSGRLSGALLDVFNKEPLPAHHDFWQHPRITITPHVAAESLPEESARQVAANILRIERGERPLGVIDRQRGY